LAEKLGVSIEHFWEVLKRQAMLDGLSSAFCILVVLAIFGAGQEFSSEPTPTEGRRAPNIRR
jgi:hypothetical protein